MLVAQDLRPKGKSLLGEIFHSLFQNVFDCAILAENTDNKQTAQLTPGDDKSGLAHSPVSRTCRNLMAFDDHRLIHTSRDPVSKVDATQRCRSIFAYEQSQVTVFIVTDIRKVLALNDFLHNIICVYTRVINPGWVILHRVLFPP